MNRLCRSITIGFVCGLLLAACAAPSATPQPTSLPPTPLPPTPTPLMPTETPLPAAPTATAAPAVTPTLSGLGIYMATSPAKVSVTVNIEHAGQPGLIDVGGYQLYLECQGSGSPTILLEHAYSWQSWKSSHLDKLQDTSRVCFYLRPGMPGSDQLPNTPITSRDQAEILHTLLQNAGIPGPYVLVAHGIGVWTDLMYAHLYPDEVAGLVCVDCESPRFRPAGLELLGPEKTDDPAIVKQIRKEMTISSFLLDPFHQEQLDGDASEVQLQDVTSLGDIPFTVLLTADSAGLSALPKELSDAMDQLWIDTSNELAALSTAGQVIATDEIAQTIVNAPEVFDAIRDVVAAAR